MTTYGLYIGTTDTHDAWEREATHKAIGHWQGKQEHIALISCLLPSDSAAIAYAAQEASATGNDYVLVIRDASPLDDNRYRVARETRTTGNRTEIPGRVPYAYARDLAGALTAVLVNAEGEIKPID